MKQRLLQVLERAGLLSAAVRAKRRVRRVRTRSRRTLHTFQRRNQLAAATEHDRVVTFIGDWPVVADRIEQFDPVAERDSNLELALGTCAEETVAHFRSRSSVAGRTRIGVIGSIKPFLEGLERDAAGVTVAVERDSVIIAATPATAATSLASTVTRSDLVLVLQPRAIGDTPYVIDGLGTACEVETWARPTPEAPVFVTEAPNRLSQSMALESAPEGLIDIREFGWLGDDWAPPFEIDAVYTWVDGDDPAWRSRQQEYRPVDAASDGTGAERYEPFDELRYSLRSLWQHAPFVRNVYLVTDRQRPDWLIDGAGVTVVDHTEIFRASSSLPVFNSHAIESQLHHIPGLAEHYVYLNDDVLFGSNVAWTNLFTVGGLARFAESRARIPIRPTSDDPAVDHSGANAQELLFELAGYAPSRKIKHTPHPQLRSVHEELEQRIPDVYERVASTRFRSIHDISLAALFHHRYGEATGRAMPGRYDYDYINLSRDDLEPLLERLSDRRPMTFCLNDASLSPNRRTEVKQLLDEWLPRMFPAPAPWETPA